MERGWYHGVTVENVEMVVFCWRCFCPNRRPLGMWPTMMWLLEEPMVICFVAILLLVPLVIAFVQTGRLGVLFATMGVLLIVIGLLIVEYVVVTEKESVEIALNKISFDLMSNDLDAILRHVDPLATKIVQRAKANLPRVEIHDVKITSRVEVKMLRLRGMRPKATAEFYGVIQGSDLGRGVQNYEYRRMFVVTMIRDEDTRWLVVDLQERNPISGARLR